MCLLLFNNNTARSRIGDSIFATTLGPCRLSCAMNLSYDLLDVLSCIANFTDLVSSDIATSAYNFSLTENNSSLKITPGITYSLNANVYDEGNHTVTHITVFQNSIVTDSNEKSIHLSRVL